MAALAEYKFKMTLLANGAASGPAYITVPFDTEGWVVADFAPSGSHPFSNVADCWQVQVFKTQLVNNFACGYLTVCDANRYPVMSHTPFCAYVGDVWPQAPVGLVHAPAPSNWGDCWMLFSVIIEKP